MLNHNVSRSIKTQCLLRRLRICTFSLFSVSASAQELHRAKVPKNRKYQLLGNRVGVPQSKKGQPCFKDGQARASRHWLLPRVGLDKLFGGPPLSHLLEVSRPRSTKIVRPADVDIVALVRGIGVGVPRPCLEGGGTKITFIESNFLSSSRRDEYFQEILSLANTLARC